MTEQLLDRTRRTDKPFGPHAWGTLSGNPSAVSVSDPPESAHPALTSMDSKQARDETRRRLNDVQIDRGTCIVTDAGSEALDLQAARAVVFYNLPVGIRQLTQTVGRVRRIGSKFVNVLIYILGHHGSSDEVALTQLNTKHQITTLLQNQTTTTPHQTSTDDSLNFLSNFADRPIARTTRTRLRVRSEKTSPTLGGRGLDLKEIHKVKPLHVNQDPATPVAERSSFGSRVGWRPPTPHAERSSLGSRAGVRAV